MPAVETILPILCWITVWANIVFWVGYLLLNFKRSQYQQKLKIAKELVTKENFPKPYQKLFRILFAAKPNRRELIWQLHGKRLSTGLSKTKIPRKLRHLSARGSKWQRLQATHILGLLGDYQSVGLLKQYTKEKDADIAYAAIKALGRMNDTHTARFLVSLLNKNLPFPPSRVATILEGMSCDFSDILLDTIKVGDPTGRFWAATLLAKFYRPEVLQTLMETLEDDDANVRAATLDSIGRIGNENSLPAIHRCLNDPMWFVRAHAALACGKVGHAASAGALVKTLKDAVWWVRFDASLALEMLLKSSARAAVVKELLSAIDSDDKFQKNRIAALLDNFGIVESLIRVSYHGGDEDSKRARRLLTLIHLAGGATQLEKRQEWKQYFAANEGAVRQ